jgi:hypothetical protein
VLVARKATRQERGRGGDRAPRAPMASVPANAAALERGRTIHLVAALIL